MQLIRTLFIAVVLLTFALTPVKGQVTVDPVGMAVSLEADEELRTEMTLNNQGDQNVAFSIKTAKPPEEDRGPCRPRRDEPEDLNILLIKSQGDNGYGWGDNNEWLEVFNNQEGEVNQVNIESIEDEDLSEYDLLCTGEDQSAGFFQQYMNNREIIEEYVDNGGLFAFFAGSNSFQQIEMPGDIRAVPAQRQDWGDVNPDFLNEDENGLVEGIEEDLPLLTPFEFFRDDNNDQNQQRIIMRGNYLSFAHIEIDDLPDDAVWYYAPRPDHNVSIIADWSFGSGYVLFTGISGTLFYRAAYHWSSMMECVNLTRWADGRWGPRWISFNPEEGEIEADDGVDIDILFITEDMEAGLYHRIVQIELSEAEEDRDDLEQTLIEISAVLSVDSPSGDITGTVTDAANRNPVEGVTIDMDRFVMTRFSDEEGAYAFENLPPGAYELTFTAADFLPTTEAIEIGEEDVELDVALLHSECSPSQNRFFMQLEPGMNFTFDFEVTNGGRKRSSLLRKICS